LWGAKDCDKKDLLAARNNLLPGCFNLLLLPFRKPPEPTLLSAPASDPNKYASTSCLLVRRMNVRLSLAGRKECLEPEQDSQKL